MTNAKPPQYRGTIVMDTSALIDFCAEVDPGLRQHGVAPTHYLAVLPFLARNNYRVVIPEAIAVEAAAVLGDGTDLHAKFRYREPYATDSLLMPFLKDAALPEGDPRKQHPGISIACNTGPAEADQYCRRLSDASQRFDLGNARTDIAAAHAARGTAIGDRAILSLLADSSRIGSDNVMLLTRNKTLAGSASSYFRMDTQSPMKLIYALGAAGLAPHVGFTLSASGDALRSDMLQAHSKLHRIHHKGVIQDFGPVETKALLKTSFYQSLEALAGTLAKPLPVAEAEPGANAAKFRAKYSRFAHARAKASQGNDESQER